MKARFFTDITCPWAWQSSRWFKKIEEELKIPTSWELFSLAIKNKSSNKSPEMREKHHKSLRVLRILQAVQNELTNDKVSNLYTAIGTNFHVQKQPIDSNLENILLECGIDNKFLENMDNEDLDKMIENSTNQAVKLCGNDVGVPIIVLNDDKKEKAIFGPIISDVPNLEESLEMWEHFKYICFNENIHELKRERFIPLGL